MHDKIVPHLWFNTEVHEAVAFYTRVFPNSKLISKVTLPGTPDGDAEVVSFSLNGHDFMAINGGPYFTMNPSISFMVNFDPSRDKAARQNLDALWEKLHDGGEVLMPLGEYPFSKRYGWVKDRYGVTWQLLLTDPGGDPRPYIIPALLFAGDVQNKAEEAVDFYVSVFKDAKQGIKAQYPEDTGAAKKGSLMFADFMLENQWLAAMDSGVEQPFMFNEGISLLIGCDTQQEIDYYWEKLSAVPESEQCGWLKDKYGVSWQVSPNAMHDMMAEASQEQLKRITAAFLPMKKLDLAKIKAAYQD